MINRKAVWQSLTLTRVLPLLTAYKLRRDRVHALQLTTNHTFPSPLGRQIGQPGDYVVVSQAGAMYHVPQELFEHLFEPALVQGQLLP